LDSVELVKVKKKYNSWIKQKTKDVIVFCNKLIDVKPPEDELQVDRYTELYSKQQPVIIIQLREIVDMHELIKQHIDHIVGNDSESEDPLRTVIKQLGDEIPKISENSTADAQLTLSTRFVNREEQVNDNTQLYDITKELIIRIFRNIPMDQLPTNSLPDILDYVKNYAKNNKNKKLKENAIDALNNVKVLESAGLISSEDNYDSFFKAVSAELSNRELRKEQQQKEIIKLKNALHEIENHHKFVKDRIESLERYLVSCRQNLTKRIKNNKTKREFKYKQLVKDGVIEEVDSDEYEKTKFVISMPEKIGVFQIEAKILSDTIIKLELEDLLEKKDNGEDKLELLLEKNDNGEEKKSSSLCYSYYYLDE